MEICSSKFDPGVTQATAVWSHKFKSSFLITADVCAQSRLCVISESTHHNRLLFTVLTYLIGCRCSLNERDRDEDEEKNARVEYIRYTFT